MQHPTDDRDLLHLPSLYFIENKIICAILRERKLGQIVKEQDEVSNAAGMSHFWFFD